MPVHRFWIVTPSFNSRRWLPCTVASVADQAGEGVVVHHHVQDGGSSDGTREWLASYAEQCARAPRDGYTFSYESAPDAGMYDAINKGWAKAPEATDILVHLNSDEQYLPNALATMSQAFHAQPQADVILGDALIIDAEGRYICHQTSVKPWAWVSRYFCVALTCTAFYRRRLISEKGAHFDTSWRIVGDMVFFHHLTQQGVRFGLCNQPTSVFVDSGENLATGPGHLKEVARFRREYGGPFAPFARWIQKANTLRRLWKDHRLPLSRSYRIYLPDAVSERTLFEISKPASLWGRKIG